MHSGNLDTKILVIDAGINDKKVKKQTLALFDDILAQLGQQKIKLGRRAFDGDGSPELKYLTVEHDLDAIKESLDSNLVFLVGNPENIRFWQVGRILNGKLQPGAYPLLFSLTTGPGYKVPLPLSPWECWIQDLKLESIPMFIRDILAWNIFPNIVSCDWADVFSAVGGHSSRFVEFETDALDFGEDYQRFLFQHEPALKRARGIFILLSIDHTVDGDRHLEIFQKLLAPLGEIALYPLKKGLSVPFSAVESLGEPFDGQVHRRSGKHGDRDASLRDFRRQNDLGAVKGFVLVIFLHDCLLSLKCKKGGNLGRLAALFAGLNDF